MKRPLRSGRCPPNLIYSAAALRPRRLQLNAKAAALRPRPPNLLYSAEALRPRRSASGALNLMYSATALTPHCRERGAQAANVESAQPLRSGRKACFFKISFERNKINKIELLQICSQLNYLLYGKFCFLVKFF